MRLALRVAVFALATFFALALVLAAFARGEVAVLAALTVFAVLAALAALAAANLGSFRLGSLTSAVFSLSSLPPGSPPPRQHPA